MLNGKIIYLAEERIQLLSMSQFEFYKIYKVSDVVGKTIEIEAMASIINAVSDSVSSLQLTVSYSTNGIDKISQNFILSGGTATSGNINNLEHGIMSFAFYPSPISGYVRMYPSEITATKISSYVHGKLTLSDVVEIDIPENAIITFSISCEYSGDLMYLTLLKAMLMDDSNTVYKLSEPMHLSSDVLVGYNYSPFPLIETGEYPGVVFDIVVAIQIRNVTPTGGILNFTLQQLLAGPNTRVNVWLQQTYFSNTVHCRRWLVKINSDGIVDHPLQGLSSVTTNSFAGSSGVPSYVVPEANSVSAKQSRIAISSSTTDTAFYITDYYVRTRK